MELLDEHGRVFGIVNVIDLLVVLFVVAVAVAGVALVLGADGPGDTQAVNEGADVLINRTVTVDLGAHSPAAAALVEPETVRFGGTNATVTDVYRTPSDAGVRVIAALRVQGRMETNAFTVGGTAVRHGSTLQITTPSYQYDANVIGLDEEAAIPTAPVTATLTANVSTAVADAVEPGDEHRIAGQTVATIQAVSREPMSGNRERLTVRVEFVARETTAGPMYGNDPIRIGRQVGFATERYEFVGEVIEVES